MIVAFPSRSSPIHELAAAWLLEEAQVLSTQPTGRQLKFDSAGHTCLLCRGRDIPQLVYNGIADVGVTGYDVYADWVSADSNRSLEAYWTSDIRLSHVVLIGQKESQSISRIYSEYPNLVSLWRDSRQTYQEAEIVPTAGSSEGIVATDQHSLGVVLATSGVTIRENGLVVVSVLLSTDMCILYGSGSARPLGSFDPAKARRCALPTYCRSLDLRNAADEQG